jgi:type VI protein secretion system component VasF
MLRRLMIALASLPLVALTALAGQPPPAQEGFVPVNELPPGQQLPAAPFLVGAYAFFLVLMMWYLWTIWRRINKVEAEMRTLTRRGESGVR